LNFSDPSLYLRQWKADRRLNYQVEKVDEYLKGLDGLKDQRSAPVLFFNASTRIHRLSLNGAYSLLGSWALRAAGIPVRYVVCQRGMQQCILGTRQDRLDYPPPCTRCTRLSQRLYPQELTIPLRFQQETTDTIRSMLQDLTFPELAEWDFQNIPLGELCLPGVGGMGFSKHSLGRTLSAWPEVGAAQPPNSRYASNTATLPTIHPLRLQLIYGI